MRGTSRGHIQIRDLKERPGALVREAEKGHLSLITKHGHPICMTVPFSQEMIQVGLHKSLALSLLKEQQITLRQAANWQTYPLKK